MFVVDVPESRLFKDPRGIGNSHENDALTVASERTMQLLDESLRFKDVLQGHLSDDEIRTYVRVFLRVVVANEFAGTVVFVFKNVPGVGRVEAYPSVVSQTAHKVEKLPISAAGLNYPFVVQVVTVDEPIRQFLMKDIELRGVSLRRFILGGIIETIFLEIEISNEPAVIAMARADVSLFDCERLPFRPHQYNTVNRNLR